MGLRDGETKGLTDGVSVMGTRGNGDKEMGRRQKGDGRMEL